MFSGTFTLVIYTTTHLDLLNVSIFMVIVNIHYIYRELQKFPLRKEQKFCVK